MFIGYRNFERTYEENLLKSLHGLPTRGQQKSTKAIN